MAEPPRTVLISGCSTGIGLELAVQLAQDPRQRFQVVATMRDLGKKGMLEAAAREALGQTLTVAQLDVCSDESVAQCLSCIQGGEVDVLGVVFNEVYAASKFALEGFFESLAIQLLQFNIFVSLVEPGPVATEFEGKLMEQVSTAEFPGTDPDTLRYFRDSYLPASRELFRNVGQSPQDVVQSSGLRPTGHRQRHQLGQTTPAPTDQRPLLPTDRPQSRGPLGRPVCANHPPPALPLAAPPPPWPSMPGLRLPPPPGPAPLSRASPAPPHP
ncbi:retinol dehydrogenase 8 isoform X6 [Equus asinus]|uniref:retinol dehydrogenase 8 isoform X6 n=1 Tax=Equus asinus TaxID=9793 RepID=UPI0038F695B6